MAPTLASEARITQRLAFQEHIKEKEVDQSLRQELTKLMKEAKEQEEIENIRKASSFKATPIRNYKPVAEVSR